MHFFTIQSRYLIALLFLFSTSVSFSQNLFLLEDKSITYRLDSHVEIFIDTAGSASFEQVNRTEFQKNFQPNKKGLTFGYLKFPLWIKVTTQNAAPRVDWYLELPAPFLEYVDFYQLDHDVWRHSESGYYKPHSKREIPHTGYVLPLTFSSDSISTVYIKITGSSPKTFPLYILEKEKFNEKVRVEDVSYGLFFGILIVMFFYNLFIYLTLRQTNYLLYICTIVCTFSIFAAASGYGGKFLWPDTPILNFYAGRISLAVLTIFLSVFTIRFLEVKKYSRVMYYLLASLVPLAIIAIILVTTKILSSAGNNLITISTTLYLVTGIVCRIKGNRNANFFIAAWTVYLLGGIFLTLRNSGVFDFNFWTTHFVEIGAAMETTIIAFALGDQYRRLKQEKEEAQALALQFQLEATEKLEAKVNERTAQLTKANETLSEALETNKAQTKIIESKNAELDAFFYRISHDLKGPISSLLGLSHIAKSEVKDGLALDYIDKQQRQVQRLDDIITGLINLTMLNHTDLLKERIDFEKMIDDCIQSLTGHPNFEKITFQKSIQSPLEYDAEFVLINAIFQNLLENAIKYAGARSPYVRVNVRKEAMQIVIEVEDNGQGIPAEYQPKIFEIFYRATQSASGSGLGLYILKRSVDILKGSIELKSDKESGSTFTIKLPVS
jgi:signal transduction histidine kinase